MHKPKFWPRPLASKSKDLFPSSKITHLRMFGSENVKLLSRFSCPFTPKQVRKNKHQLVAQHGDYTGFSSSSIPT